MASAAALLQGLLAAVRHTAALDAELQDFIAAVIEDPAEDEDTLDTIVQLLCEAAPSFAVLDSAAQAELVLKLLDDVRLCCGCCAPTRLAGTGVDSLPVTLTCTTVNTGAVRCA
jgi:hypothetical protein